MLNALDAPPFPLFSAMPKLSFNAKGNIVISDVIQFCASLPVEKLNSLWVVLSELKLDYIYFKHINYF